MRDEENKKKKEKSVLFERTRAKRQKARLKPKSDRAHGRGVGKEIYRTIMEE